MRSGQFAAFRIFLKDLLDFPYPLIRFCQPEGDLVQLASADACMLLKQLFPPFAQPVDCFHNRCLHIGFTHRRTGTDFARRTPRSAAPDRSVFLRCLPDIGHAAVSANQLVHHGIFPGRKPLFSHGFPFLLPAQQFPLRNQKDLPGNNGLMGVLHIVLGKHPVISAPLLCQKIHGIAFLQQQIALVFFVLQHAQHRPVVPGIAAGCLDPVVLQMPHNLSDGHALQERPKDLPDDDRALRIDNQIAAPCLLRVADKPGVIQHGPAPLEVIMDADADVLADALAFLLSQAGQDRNQQFPGGVQGVDAFLFKDHGYAQVLQLPDILQTVQGIPCPAADGLCDDHVNLPLLTVGDHPVEVDPLLRRRGADALIRVDFHQRPGRIGVDQIREMGNLSLIAGFLFLRVSGYAGITGYPKPARLLAVASVNHLQFCRYDPDCHIYSPKT